MRKHGKRDKNHNLVRGWVESLHGDFFDCADLGHGKPDCWISFGRYDTRHYPVEIKSPGGRLTKDEIMFANSVNYQIYIVTTIDDVLSLFKGDPTKLRTVIKAVAAYAKSVDKK